MQKAVKFKAKGKVSEMRKVLIHAIRDTKLFRQIQRHGYNEVFLHFKDCWMKNVILIMIRSGLFVLLLITKMMVEYAHYK